MKIHSAHLRLSFWLTAVLPLPGYADVQIPFWLDPEWIQTKLMDLHIRNSERIAQEQAQAKAKAQAQAQAQAKNNASAAIDNGQNPRRSTPAPVETALPKMNEKYLSKEELAELRKQLRQRP
jgi:hypothetical protein